MTELRTARRLLRPPNKGDLPAFYQILADPRAMRYWSTPEHDSLDQKRRLV